MAGVAKIVCIGFVGSLAVTLLILGCVLPGRWWPLLVVVFYLFTPLPLLFVTRTGGYEMMGDDSPSKTRDFALFCCTGIVVSTLAFPIILTRAPISEPRLDATGCLLTEMATICVYATCGLFSASFDDDDDV